MRHSSETRSPKSTVPLESARIPRNAGPWRERRFRGRRRRIPWSLGRAEEEAAAAEGGGGGSARIRNRFRRPRGRSPASLFLRSQRGRRGTRRSRRTSSKEGVTHTAARIREESRAPLDRSSCANERCRGNPLSPRDRRSLSRYASRRNCPVLVVSTEDLQLL